nr:hypothetical protein [Tanacetum cinerariifolium]
MPSCRQWLTKALLPLWQHVMLFEVQMATIAIILERVLEGQNELLMNVLTLTFSSVNHYTSKAQRKLSVFPNGLKEWSLFSISNTHVKTVGHDAAYDMSWKTLIKMMTDSYCPRNEIKKGNENLGSEGKGGLLDMIHGSVVAFKLKTMQEELALLCGRMFPEESDKIEKYIRGLLDMIHGSVVAFKLKTMQEQQPLKKQGVAIAYTTGPGERKKYAGTLPL